MASAGRGVVRARRGVAKLLGESDPHRVVFSTGGTDSLNLALFGLLRPGDHVVATVCEHNAVLRPLLALGESGVETTWIGCDSRGLIDTTRLTEAIRPKTRLVAMIHASNVTGAVQPVEQVAATTKRLGKLLLVDAAQTLGRLSIDVRQLGADLVAAPGHKGMLGPLGVGVLWLAPGVEQQLRPLRFGGAASGGAQHEMPDSMPDKYEAGSLNLPGIAGLAAGVEHVLAVGVDQVQQRLTEARRRLAEGLVTVDGVTVYGPSEPALQSGVVSFEARGYDPHELATLLSSIAGVESRAGLYCAPRLHEALGTAARGGLVRFSPGADTRGEDLDDAIEAVRQLAQSPPQ